MKMLSYNIRGAGSTVKSKEVIELINLHKVDFCCLQESKLEKVNANICRSMWGMGNFGWMEKPSNGRFGGIITLWDSDKFACLSYWEMEGAVIVNGLWGLDRLDVSSISVHRINYLID